MTSNEPEPVWILGLMHSGTTILWRAFRKDTRFLCFDEPMSGLDVLPGQNSRSSYGEFVHIFKRDPKKFWGTYAPLHILEELDSSFSEQQKVYIRFLLNQAHRVVIDETHLHLHLGSLREIAPKSHVLHLSRRASAFATSHLMPSWSRETTWPRRIVRRLRSAYNKRVFWTRHDFLPGLRRDAVIGCHPDSKFGLMLSGAGYDAKAIMAAPTVVRLLAYWHYHYHYLEREGPRYFGARFTSVRYEDFAADPAGTMRRLYDWIDFPPPEKVDYSEVHPPKPPFREGDRRWHEAARIAGFTEQEIETLL